MAALAEVPAFRPSVDAWLRPALEVCSVVSEPHDSLGIPTWHYGHEPSNVFATGIAKYFRNATREAILLEVCDAGIVFLPGAGGTVQEVFQDGCENYYADESSVAEMVLVGRAYWTETLPAWPLLRSLARGRPMEDRVHLVDHVDEAVDAVGSGGQLAVAGHRRRDLAVVLDERLVDRLPRAALDRASRGEPHPAAELRVAGQPVDVAAEVVAVAGLVEEAGHAVVRRRRSGRRNAARRRGRRRRAPPGRTGSRSRAGRCARTRPARRTRGRARRRAGHRGSAASGSSRRSRASSGPPPTTTSA